ncbi:MAG TPA: DUF4232 domain-containing protein [Streptosporangiaceae bacterium]
MLAAPVLVGDRHPVRLRPPRELCPSCHRTSLPDRFPLPARTQPKAGHRGLKGQRMPQTADHVIPSRTVVLAPGATAHTILRYGDVTAATAPGCHPTFSTFELRIYPPGQRRATYAAFDLEACSHAGPVYLGVEPVRPGVGTISG